MAITAPAAGAVITVAPLSAADTTRAEAAALQAVLASLDAVVAAARVDLQDATLSHAQRAALYDTIAQAGAAKLAYAAQLLPAGAPSSVTVTPGDTIFSLAQRYLGDALRFAEIQALNGLRGMAIAPGRILQMPQI